MMSQMNSRKCEEVRSSSSDRDGMYASKLAGLDFSS